jgi:hypothetical protein
MAEQDKTPFNLRLLRRELQLGKLDERGTAVGERRDVARGVQMPDSGSGRYTLEARGLAAGVGTNTTSPWGFSQALPPPMSRARLARETSAQRIQAIFNQSNPANVERWDLTQNDSAFADRRIVDMVTRVAKTFRVHPALLAEHLVAEMHFAEYGRIPKGMKLEEWMKTRPPIFTSAAGLDDFVKERASIDKLVPAARQIGNGEEADAMPAESDINKYMKRGELPPAKLFKPQRKLSMYDGIRASAAYLRYKEIILRHNLGEAEFESLPLPAKLQLIRLAVNPTKIGQSKGEAGTRHWIRVAKSGELDGLFNFQALTSRQTTDSSNVEHVVRRTTIHTARALHMAETIFGE